MKKVPRKKPSLYSKLRFLMSKRKDINITYVYPDKTRVVRSLNNEFLSLNGKPRKVDDIVADLFAIKEDRGADYFIV